MTAGRSRSAAETRVVHCKKAPYDVYIGRPSKWGNPFQIGPDASGHRWNRKEVIQLYRTWLRNNAPELIAEARRELKGKVLGCWCAPLPCHGDILAALVDGRLKEEDL